MFGARVHDDRPLFAHAMRVDPTVRRAGEPTWDFLDRVDDPAFDRVRRAMNDWFLRSPGDARADLRGRLSSGDDEEFHAAWFELYLNELHLRLGFGTAAHPVLDDTGTRPDFALTRDGTTVLLEATVLGDRSKAGREARRDAVVAAIERIESRDFALWFEIEREGTDSPPMRSVRRRVERWLASLTWAHIRAAQERLRDPDLLPTRTERVGDWEFSFRAWPRRPEDRGETKRTIMAGPGDGGVFAHPVPILERLDHKAAKYGRPTEPVIIAIRLDRLAIHADDLVAALMGDPDHDRRGLFRRRDGLPRNEHVAGVLAWDLELRPWSVTRRSPTLWVNPNSKHAVEHELPWTVMSLRGPRPVIARGPFVPAAVFGDLPGHEVFDDQSAWPGTPFARDARV